ncbi:FkbM family methyltransferase [Priestia flexa]|uniref:FkbM family methyltransferase n=1 Tax=Priestia flexa TaxID=86664 RepID=UPI0024934731|nr:FkbM family methyltransferase [Priestia flexa]
MTPFLSLCMIVKNEEKVLKRCLESVDGLIDEIIIVDTGSTDNTKEVATEFNTTIFDYKWNNNFSDARNYAQSKAKGKWILYLDADEYVDPQNFKEAIEKLKELDEKASFEAILVTQINFAGNYGEVVNPCLTTRFYKNHSSIKFHRPIHEQLYKENGELSVGFLNFYIYHSGYLKTTHKEKNKSERNVSLLISELKENENAFDYFNMGNEYGVQGRIEEALDSYQKSYLLKKDTEQIWVPNAVERIINCLIRLDRYEEGLKVAEDASVYWKNIADFKCLMAHIYLQQNRVEDAEYVLLELVQNRNQYMTCHNINYLEYFPYKFLGEIYERQNEIKKAVEYYSYALNFNDKDLYIIEKLYNLLLKYDDKKNVVTFIQNNKSMNRFDNRAILLKGLLDIGEVEIVEHFISYWNIDCPEGILLKIHLLKGEYKDAYDLTKEYNINLLLNDSWFDINDAVILALQLDNVDFNKLFIESISDEYEWINRLFNEVKGRDLSIYKQEIINLLQKCIQYEKFEVFERIVNTLSVGFQKLDIGNLLYKNGFKTLALDFYQELELNKLDEQAFVNIIESLIEQANYDDALRFSYMAIEQDRLDYRIFKMAIGILDKMEIYDDKEKLIEITLQYYPESEYIKEFMGISRKNNILNTQKVLLADNTYINVFQNDFIGKIISETNDYYERLELDTFSKYIPNNSIIYDIGTNIGNHTLFFSKYTNPSKIFAFEPIADVCKVLEQNIKDNNINNAEIINVAVADRSAKGNMHLQKGNIGASHVSFNQNGDIDVVKLDDLKLPPPNFIKIDVENFEYEAILGMENILINNRPILWVEIRDKNLAKVNNKLYNLGYKLINQIHDKYDYGNYIYIS